MSVCDNAAQLSIMTSIPRVCSAADLISVSFEVFKLTF